MSLQGMIFALEIEGVTPAEKLLLVVLGNYCDPEMRCYPSHATLAKYTGLSERTILTALKRLEEGGIIRRQRRQRQDGSRSTDLITIQTATISPRGGGEIDGQSKPQLSAGGGETISPLEPRTNLEIGTKGTSNEVLVVRADDVQIAFDAYNLMAEVAGLPIARDLTPSRRKALKARLATVSPRGWAEALESVMNTPFLLGQSDKGWKADLDFLLQPKSLQRVLEGSYKGLANVRSQPHPDRGREQHQDRLASLQRGALAALDRRGERWGSAFDRPEPHPSFGK